MKMNVKTLYGDMDGVIVEDIYTAVCPGEETKEHASGRFLGVLRRYAEKRPEDFAVYLEREGVKVEGVRPLPGEPFRATSGCAVKVADCEVGVYKYDRSSTVQDKRVKKIAEEGRTYIQGIPFPVEVRGSFMFLGLEKNPQKHQIIKVIDKFY